MATIHGPRFITGGLGRQNLRVVLLVVVLNTVVSSVGREVEDVNGKDEVTGHVGHELVSDRLFAVVVSNDADIDEVFDELDSFKV